MAEIAKRPPQTKDDIKIYDKWGTMFFKYYFDKFFPEYKDCKIFDASKDEFYYGPDVDLIIDVKNKYGHLSSLNFLSDEEKQAILDSKDFIKIDVKVDSTSIRTKRLAYEFTSHGELGWATRTYSDYIINVISDEKYYLLDNGSMRVVGTPISVMLISMIGWREFVNETFRVWKRGTNNYWFLCNTLKKENVWDLLCYLDGGTDTYDNNKYKKGLRNYGDQIIVKEIKVDEDLRENKKLDYIISKKIVDKWLSNNKQTANIEK